MTRSFSAKTGDTRTIEVTCLADGAPINAPGATATFSMKNTTTNQVIFNRAAAEVLQTNPLKLKFQWQEEQSGLIDENAYGFEFRVALPGGVFMTFPSSGLYPLIIDRGIGT